MCAVFTADSVRQIIEQCRRVEDAMRQLWVIRGRPGNEAVKQLTALERGRYFDRACERCITAGQQECDTETEDLSAVIVPVYREMLARRVDPQLNACAQWVKQLEQLKREAAPRANGIQWLFANGRKKQAAEQAYNELRRVLSNDSAARLKQMGEQLEIITNAPAKEANAYYAANRIACAQTMAELYPKIASSQSRYSSIEEIIRLFDELIRTADDVRQAEDRMRFDIRSAADRIASREVMNVLRTMPIEELNQGKNGIRVKLLRDNGFESIADICAVRPGTLSSINGISPEGEDRIRRLGMSFADEYRKDVKLKLSADDRSREADALIRACCAYKRHTAAADRIELFMAENRGTIRRSVNRLKAIGNGFRWYFSDPASKADVTASYAKLSEIIRSAYSDLGDAIAEVSGHEMPSNEAGWKDFSSDPIPYFNILEEIVPGMLGNKDDLYGLPEELALAIRDQEFFTDGLHCTLRRYQEWGVKYILHQEKVILADEMGLGKTVQAIASMVSLSNTGETHFMVVCPASVLENWCREIKKHSILEAIRVHGPSRDSALEEWKKNGGVAVTTYETTGNIELEEDYRFAMLIVDEAHYIKNPAARRSVYVKQLCGHADRLLFMTGTAMENKVDEMVGLIRILRPSVASKLQHLKVPSTAPLFRKEAAPVYYRRKREDVLTELPELIEKREWCVMTQKEAKIYEESVRAKKFADMRRVSWNCGSAADSSKANRLRELIDEAAEDGRKILIFSFFLDTLRVVGELAGERLTGTITGSVPPEGRQRIIDEFDRAEPGAVLAAQIQSGGTGLNIQSASVVVICEPQLKPSIENQAISRAYRMGQARNVLVYRLLCEESVDERITQLLEEKQRVFDTFADQSEVAKESLALDEKAVNGIVRDEYERVTAKKVKLERT